MQTTFRFCKLKDRFVAATVIENERNFCKSCWTWIIQIHSLKLMENEVTLRSESSVINIDEWQLQLHEQHTL